MYGMGDNVAPFPLFLQLVVKIFKGSLSRHGNAEDIMNEEMRKMTKLQELGLPFRGTVEASTTQWKERVGATWKYYPALAIKTAGR